MRRLSRDIKYSRTPNRVHIILLFREGTSASLKLLCFVASEEQIDGSLFSTYDSKIFVTREDQQNLAGKEMEEELKYKEREASRISFAFRCALSA